MDDNARIALRHERMLILSGMVQELRREVAHLQTDLDIARDKLRQAERAVEAERAARVNAEQALAMQQEVYRDLLRIVKEREAGR
jgi:hypothetical protein